MLYSVWNRYLQIVEYPIMWVCQWWIPNQQLWNMMMKLMINSWLPSIMAFKPSTQQFDLSCDRQNCTSQPPGWTMLLELSGLSKAPGGFSTIPTDHFPSNPSIFPRGPPGLPTEMRQFMEGLEPKGSGFDRKFWSPQWWFFFGKLHGIFQGKSWDSKFAESRFWQF